MYRFRGPFNKQHGKAAEALLKSASQHLYQIHWSLPTQLRWKKSLLLTSKILVLYVNTLAADKKYPVLNRDNLTIPVQIKLSRKQKFFSKFFAVFLKSSLILDHFEKNMTLIAFVFRKLPSPKMLLDKCLKSTFSDDRSRSNMVNVPKDNWNLHHSAFIRFIDHCQGNLVGKSLSYWHAKSRSCLLTYCWRLKASCS